MVSRESHDSSFGSLLGSEMDRLTERALLRRLPEFTAVNPDVLRFVVHRAIKSSLALKLVPSIAALAAFFVWIVLMAKLMDFIDHRFSDVVIPGIIDHGNWSELFAGLFFLLTLNGAIILSFVGAYASHITLLACWIGRRLRNDECLSCGYSLRGHPPGDCETRCPECGYVHPIRRRNITKP